MQSLRIFISSPGDVAEERQIAGKVIERLQGKYWSFVRLDDVFWERRAIRATAHYQDELIQPGNCDLVVGLLWSRLGSPLPKKFARFADADPPTGTEWELEEAFDAYEANRAQLEKAGRDSKQAARVAKPDILIYRRKPAPDRATLDAARLNQLAQLEAYLHKNYFNDDGTIKRPILGYKNLEDFDKKLTTHLEELILRQIPEVSPGFEPPPISGSPFKGLQAFDFKDSDRYFGRNREIRELQRQLVASAEKGLPFMLIYGGSGFGKSSIMRAGLAPVPPSAAKGDDFLERLWNAAPKLARERSSKVKVGKAWTRIPAPQRPAPDAAVAALESWKRSDSWTKDAGQFIPGLHRWIEERKWDDLPASLERPRPKAPPPDIPAEFIAWARQHSPSIGPAVAWQTPAIRDRFEDDRKAPDLDIS